MFAVFALASYFYLPTASMTNPPSNWGYARTMEGFFHVLSRGQFERLSPTESFGVLLEQLGIYARIAIKKFGPFFLLTALVPFCFLRRIQRQDRGLMLGFLAFYLCTSVLMTILLNPPPGKGVQQLLEQYFPPSYIILALWTGLGLMLVGTITGRQRKTIFASAESSAVSGDPGI